jgi:ligand-binding sensor domain-containing protein
MLKQLWKLILFLPLAVSCQKDDLVNNHPAKIKFDVTTHLLEGKRIDCLDIDSKGNGWIASGKELFYISGNDSRTYNLDFEIRSLAVARDGSVWIGSGGGGLGHLTGKEFIWYTSSNSNLPWDYVRDVKIAPDGKVWFSSSAYNIGGLGVFNDGKLEIFTPENSPLNQNIINEVEIDQNGLVYIATAGTVGRSNIYRISDKSWDCLGDEKGTFYWVFSLTTGPSGIIYLVEDFSLSSSSLSKNTLYEFRDNKWEKIEFADIFRVDFFAHIKADRRNYCWVGGQGDNSAILHVYNGETWLSSPEGTLPDDYITAIEVDDDNNIWVGTFQNGVFILNQ